MYILRVSPHVCLTAKLFILPFAFDLIGPLSIFAMMPPATLVLPLAPFPPLTT